MRYMTGPVCPALKRERQNLGCLFRALLSPKGSLCQKEPEKPQLRVLNAAHRELTQYSG